MYMYIFETRILGRDKRRLSSSSSSSLASSIHPTPLVGLERGYTSFDHSLPLERKRKGEKDRLVIIGANTSRLKREREEEKNYNIPSDH